MSDAPDKPDKPAAPPAPAAPAAKTSKLVLLLLVMNLGASGFGVFHMLTAEPAGAATPHAEKKEAPKPPPTAEVTGPVISLEPFVVNLDEPGNARYLRVNLQLELSNDGAQPAIQKSLLLVRDTILSHLSGLHLADTLGAQAKEKLRTDLLAKLTAAVGPNKIRRVFFQEFVVQ